jgi:hypothetical protein
MLRTPEAIPLAAGPILADRPPPGSRLEEFPAVLQTYEGFGPSAEETSDLEVGATPLHGGTVRIKEHVAEILESVTHESPSNATPGRPGAGDLDTLSFTDATDAEVEIRGGVLQVVHFTFGPAAT